MPRINLLPHREQKRKERRRDFTVMLLGAALAAGIVVGCGKLMYAGWIDAQKEKNALLTKEIEKLNAQIADIQDNPIGHQWDIDPISGPRLDLQAARRIVDCQEGYRGKVIVGSAPQLTRQGVFHLIRIIEQTDG